MILSYVICYVNKFIQLFFEKNNTAVFEENQWNNTLKCVQLKQPWVRSMKRQFFQSFLFLA